MIAHMNFFRVGRVDDIMNSGWIKVKLLGWDIVVLFRNNEFFAIERGGIQTNDIKTYFPDKLKYSSSGSPNTVEKLLSGPTGSDWATLRQFPIRIEDGYVFVGIEG